MIVRTFLGSIVLALLLAGCAGAVSGSRATSQEEARRAVALLVTRWQSFSDLKAVADVTVRRGGTTDKLSGALLAKSPGALRFEALSPFGTPFLLLTVADEQLTAYSIMEARALQGPLNGDTTSRWLGAPFEADQLVGLLVGRVVPPRDLRTTELVPPDADGPSVKLEGKDQSQRVWLDFQSGIVHKVEIAGGRINMVVRYEREAGADVPTTVRASAPEMDIDASIQYRSPALNTGVDAARFTPTLPERVRIQRFR